MRRLLALPVLLCVASVVVAFGGTKFGRKADRFALEIARWAAPA